MDIDITTIATYGAGLVAIIALAKIILMPLGCLLKLLLNAILGGAALWAINLIGSHFDFTIAINWLSALIVGTLGIPGAALLVIWKLFF